VIDACLAKLVQESLAVRPIGDHGFDAGDRGVAGSTSLSKNASPILGVSRSAADHIYDAARRDNYPTKGKIGNICIIPM
jgi:hypothetical protein